MQIKKQKKKQLPMHLAILIIIGVVGIIALVFYFFFSKPRGVAPVIAEKQEWGEKLRKAVDEGKEWPAMPVSEKEKEAVDRYKKRTGRE